MKTFIIGMGTRGDVQPYVALGLGLQKAGHEVTLCTSKNFQPFVSEYSLSSTFIFDDVMELLNSEEWRAAIDDTKSYWQRFNAYRKLFKLAAPMQLRMLDETWAAVQEAKPDVIVYHPKAYGVPHFAEKMGIPAILAMLVPGFVPTRAFPAVGFGFPEWKLGSWYNYGSAWIAGKLTASGVGKYIKSWRKTNGWPALSRGVDTWRTPLGRPIPVVHGYSGHVMPAPDDWPAHVSIAGYWFLDQPREWEPPVSLTSFLNAGDPPVYIGFGSMSGPKTEHVSRIVVEALQKARVRGILATGWGGLNADQLPETIHKIDMAPHDWLFPRMAAVVHHGGAGTTAAALRAGRPSLVCPFAMDQPFWGRRVNALGAGPAPIKQRALAVDTLAPALRELVDREDYRKNAEIIGEKLRAEDGLGNAVQFIEAQVAGFVK